MADEYFKKIFSDNLKYYMRKKGCAQIDLIIDLNFDKSAVSSWVNGTRLPRMDKIDALARYFGVKRSDLIEEHTDKPAAPAPLRKDESELLDLYNSMNPAGMKELMKMAKLFSGSDEYRLKGDDSESLKSEA